MILSSEDIELIDKLHDLAMKGWYADSMTVTNIYNKVFEKREGNTNCGSCIRRRILELWAAKETIVKKLAQEQEKNEEQPLAQPEENKAQEEAEKPKKEPRKKTKK